MQDASRKNRPKRAFWDLREYLSSEIFEYGGKVDGSPGAGSLSVATLFQEPSDTTNGELEPRLDRLRHRLLPLAAFSSCGSPPRLRGLH